MSNLPGKILALVVIMFVTIIGCLTLLIAVGKDPSSLIGIASSVFVPSLISLVTLGQVNTMHQTVGTIQKQTNGHMTAALAAAGVKPVQEKPANVESLPSDIESSETWSPSPTDLAGANNED